MQTISKQSMTSVWGRWNRRCARPVHADDWRMHEITSQVPPGQVADVRSRGLRPHEIYPPLRLTPQMARAAGPKARRVQDHSGLSDRCHRSITGQLRDRLGDRPLAGANRVLVARRASRLQIRFTSRPSRARQALLPHAYRPFEQCSPARRYRGQRFEHTTNRRAGGPLMQLPDRTTIELVTASTRLSVKRPPPRCSSTAERTRTIRPTYPSPEAPDVWEHTKTRRATSASNLNGRRAVEVLIDEQTCAQLRTVDDVLDAATALIEPRLDNLFNDLNP